MSSEEEYNVYDDESFEEYYSSDEEVKTKESCITEHKHTSTKAANNNIYNKPFFGTKYASSSYDHNTSELQKSHGLDVVTFVAFHQTPISLYHQYLKTICGTSTTSVSLSSSPILVKESSCGSTSIYPHVSESSQTTTDDDTTNFINPTRYNKEVQCVNGFDDTYFENFLKLCREEKYSELIALATTPTPYKNNEHASSSVGSSSSTICDTSITRLTRFLRVASNVIEKLLIEEERYRSAAAAKAKRISKGYSSRSSITTNKQTKTINNGIWNFQSDALRDDDNFFIGGNQHRLFSCISPQYSHLRRFLESRTISNVQYLVTTKKAPIGLITIHIPSPSCQGTNNTTSVTDSKSTLAELHDAGTYSAATAEEKTNLCSFNNNMTIICLWEANSRSSSESATLSSNDSSLEPQYLLFGKGVASCTLPLSYPDSDTMSSSPSSIIVACGTEEGSLILWDTYSYGSALAMNIPYLERLKKLLQVDSTTSIQMKMPSFHSDITEQEHTTRNNHHFSKILNLAALPNYDDVVLVPSRRFFHDFILLASMDERGLIILWQIHRERGERRSLKCIPLCRIGLQNGDIVDLSNGESYNNSIVPKSLTTPQLPSISMTAPILYTTQAIEWLPMCTTTSSSSSMRLLFAAECSTIRRLDIQMSNMHFGSVNNCYAITQLKNYARCLSGKNATTSVNKKQVIATNIVVSSYNSELFLSQWSDRAIVLFQTCFPTPIMEWKLDNMVLLRDLLDYPIVELTARTTLPKRYLLQLLSKIYKRGY